MSWLGFLAGERTEQSRVWPRPRRSQRRGRTELEHFLAPGGEEQQRHVAQVLSEVIEEGEHRIVGPVQVLDDKHQ